MTPPPADLSLGFSQDEPPTKMFVRLLLSEAIHDRAVRMEIVLERAATGGIWRAVDPSLVLAANDRVHFRFRTDTPGKIQLFWATTLTKMSTLTNIDVDVAGVRRLVILADFGDDLDVADHLDLGNARLIQ